MEEESAPGPSSSKRSRVRDISPTEQEFRDIGIVIMKREKCRNLSELSFLRRSRSHFFGVSPKLCAYLGQSLPTIIAIEAGGLNGVVEISLLACVSLF